MKRSLRFKVFRINIISVAAAVIVFMIFGIGQVRRFANIMEQTSTLCFLGIKAKFRSHHRTKVCCLACML